MRLGDLDALLEKVWDVDCRCGYVQVVDRADIETAPTINPEDLRPKGRWEDGDWTGVVRCYYLNPVYGDNRHLCEHTPLNCGNCHMNEAKNKKLKKCSNCGKQERVSTTYCPNCGAKMEVNNYG